MKNKSIKHLIVLIACCGMAASAIGLCINASGVFYTPVSESLGIGRGTFALHMTCFQLTTALASLCAAKIVRKYPLKPVLWVSILISAFTFIASSIATQAWMFYVLSGIRGFFVTLFSSITLTMIINNWFSKNHGMVTSLVFSFSGIVGSIFAPVFTNLITLYGWQAGFVIKGILLVVFCLPALLYPFHMDPRKDGILPFGYEETPVVEKATTQQAKTAFSFKQISFILFASFSVLVCSATNLSQHFPGFASSIGYDASVGAVLVSAVMVGNIVSKLIIGALSDWLGAIKAVYVMLTSILIGSVLLLLGMNQPMLLLGAFLFGASYSIGAVGIPLLTKYFFKEENYTTVFPVITFANGIGGAVSISLIGYIYDFFHSYAMALYFGVAVALFGIVLIQTLTKKVNQ